MKTTVKAYLHWHKYDWQDEATYQLDCADMTKVSPDYVLVREMFIEVEVPDNFDPTPKQIAALREKKQEILAAAHVQAENIEGQIQSLLSIEFKPEVV